MERLTARSAGIPILDPKHEEKYTHYELIDILINRLTPYEDLELTQEQLKQLVGAKNGHLFASPVKVGDKVYSVTYDEVPKEYVIGEPEEIVEVGTRGFFLAWDSDPDYPVEFHPYEELGKEFFLTFEDALRAKERLEGVHQ